MTNHTDALRFLQVIFPDHGTHAVFANLNPAVHTRDFNSLDPARDCYWSIAAFPPGVNSNRKEDALEVRALVIDDVGSKGPSAGAVQLALGRPTTIVLTSPGNFQWGYRLTRPVAIAAWDGFFDGVEDLIGHSRALEAPAAQTLMRLPMGVNTKPKNNRFPVQLVELNPEISLDPDTIPLRARAPNTGAPKAAPRDPTERVSDIRGLMKLLPNDVEYDEWIATGERILALALDGEAGREAFHEWSSRTTLKAYDAEYTETKWSTLTADRTRGQWLLNAARDVDALGFDLWWQGEAGRGVFDDGEEPPDPFDVAGRYDPAQVDMADHIIGEEKGRLGWLDGDPRTWVMFDPMFRRWVKSVDDLMRAVVWEEIARRRAVGVDPKVSRAMQTGKWHGAVAGLLTKNKRLKLKPELFDADLGLMGAPGGTIGYDPVSGKVMMRPGKASDYITKSTLVDPAPPGTKSAMWEKFLDDYSCGDAELRLWWQVYIGYCMTGHLSEELVVFVQGGGNNGKGTFFKAIGEAMGDYHARAGQQTFMEQYKGHKAHSTELAVLEGTRLVTVPEVPQHSTWDMELVKGMSGGDPVAARRMFQDQRNFMPQCKLIFTGNDLPNIMKVDESVRRRFRLVPAKFHANPPDTGLKERLKATEYPAVLRWALDGWELWEAAGRQLPACAVIEQASRGYMSTSDTFGRWKKTQLKPSGDRKTWVKVGEAFRSWDAFRSAEGAYDATPRAPKHLLDRLNEGESKPYTTMYGNDGAAVIIGWMLDNSAAAKVF